MSLSHVSYAIPPTCVTAVRDVCYHSVASLTFLVWDFLVKLDDEVQYIWPMRNNSPFKWMYFFIRYVVILEHVTHNFITQALANGNNPPMLCKMWHPYIVAVAQTVETSLELILASRVFALYNRSKKITFLLSILIFAEVAGTARILWLRHDSIFHGTCLLQAVDNNGIKQAVLGFAVHCTLICLTLSKYFIALRAGWGRTPLVSLVVRDNSTVYGTIMFILVSVVLLCGLEEERGIAVFYWATALSSISGCRMILSMERFARKESSALDQTCFTSEFSIGTVDSGRQHDRSGP